MVENCVLGCDMKLLVQALGDSSKRASINYPQLLGKTVLINTPSYLRYIFHGFSAFMPQSFIDKVTVTLTLADRKHATCYFGSM
jgi:hypothetical protein